MTSGCRTGAIGRDRPQAPMQSWVQWGNQMATSPARLRPLLRRAVNQPPGSPHGRARRTQQRPDLLWHQSIPQSSPWPLPRAAPESRISSAMSACPRGQGIVPMTITHVLQYRLRSLYAACGGEGDDVQRSLGDDIRPRIVVCSALPNPSPRGNLWPRGGPKATGRL